MFSSVKHSRAVTYCCSCPVLYLYRNILIHQKIVCAFKVLTALNPIKLNLMLQTWDLLIFVVCFRKKNILWRTLAESVEKIEKRYETKIFYHNAASIFNPL